MKYENNKILEQSKEKVLEYLNKKYGDGEFEITDASYYESDFSYEIKTSYFDNVFIVEGYNYHNSFDVYNDEFIFEYLSSKYNEEVINYYDVEEILKQEISKNFEEKYNINIDYTYFEFDELEFEKAFFNKIIDKMIYIN